MEVRLVKNKKSFTDFVSLFFALTLIFGVAIFFLILSNAYDDHIKGKLNDALTSSTAVDADSNVTKVLEQIQNDETQIFNTHAGSSTGYQFGG